MKKGILLFVLGCMLIGSGCSGDDDIDYTEIEIRIKNVSNVEFLNVLVTGGGETHDYGDVAQGISTDYKAHAFAYAYAGITLSANGEEYRLQPIDFVGEETLAPGKYTYELDIEPLETFNSILLTLEED